MKVGSCDRRFMMKRAIVNLGTNHWKPLRWGFCMCEIVLWFYYCHTAEYIFSSIFSWRRYTLLIKAKVHNDFDKGFVASLTHRSSLSFCVCMRVCQHQTQTAQLCKSLCNSISCSSSCKSIMWTHSLSVTHTHTHPHELNCNWQSNYWKSLSASPLMYSCSDHTCTPRWIIIWDIDHADCLTNSDEFN